MNTYIHFSHEQQKSIERDLSSVKDWQKFIVECGDALCKDDVITISGKCYCHVNLGEFIVAMCDICPCEINLSDIYEHFQEELDEIRLNTVKKWRLGLPNDNFKSPKREEFKNNKRVIFSEEQILYIMDALANKCINE